MKSSLHLILSDDPFRNARRGSSERSIQHCRPPSQYRKSGRIWVASHCVPGGVSASVSGLATGLSPVMKTMHVLLRGCLLALAVGVTTCSELEAGTCIAMNHGNDTASQDSGLQSQFLRWFVTDEVPLDMDADEFYEGDDYGSCREAVVCPDFQDHHFLKSGMNKEIPITTCEYCDYHYQRYIHGTIGLREYELTCGFAMILSCDFDNQPFCAQNADTYSCEAMVGEGGIISPAEQHFCESQWVGCPFGEDSAFFNPDIPSPCLNECDFRFLDYNTLLGALDDEGDLSWFHEAYSNLIDEQVELCTDAIESFCYFSDHTVFPICGDIIQSYDELTCAMADFAMPQCDELLTGDYCDYLGHDTEKCCDAFDQNDVCIKPLFWTEYSCYEFIFNDTTTSITSTHSCGTFVDINVCYEFDFDIQKLPQCELLVDVDVCNDYSFNLQYLPQCELFVDVDVCYEYSFDLEYLPQCELLVDRHSCEQFFDFDVDGVAYCYLYVDSDVCSTYGYDLQKLPICSIMVNETSCDSLNYDLDTYPFCINYVDRAACSDRGFIMSSETYFYNPCDEYVNYEECRDIFNFDPDHSCSKQFLNRSTCEVEEFVPFDCLVDFIDYDACNEHLYFNLEIGCNDYLTSTACIEWFDFEELQCFPHLNYDACDYYNFDMSHTSFGAMQTACDDLIDFAFCSRVQFDHPQCYQFYDAQQCQDIHDFDLQEAPECEDHIDLSVCEVYHFDITKLPTCVNYINSPGPCIEYELFGSVAICNELIDYEVCLQVDFVLSDCADYLDNYACQILLLEDSLGILHPECANYVDYDYCMDTQWSDSWLYFGQEWTDLRDQCANYLDYEACRSMQFELVREPACSNFLDLEACKNYELLHSDWAVPECIELLNAETCEDFGFDERFETCAEFITLEFCIEDGFNHPFCDNVEVSCPFGSAVSYDGVPSPCTLDVCAASSNTTELCEEKIFDYCQAIDFNSSACPMSPSERVERCSHMCASGLEPDVWFPSSPADRASSTDCAPCPSIDESPSIGVAFSNPEEHSMNFSFGLGFDPNNYMVSYLVVIDAPYEVEYMTIQLLDTPCDLYSQYNVVEQFNTGLYKKKTFMNGIYYAYVYGFKSVAVSFVNGFGTATEFVCNDVGYISLDGGDELASTRHFQVFTATRFVWQNDYYTGAGPSSDEAASRFSVSSVDTFATLPYYLSTFTLSALYSESSCDDTKAHATSNHLNSYLNFEYGVTSQAGSESFTPAEDRVSSVHYVIDDGECDTTSQTSMECNKVTCIDLDHVEPSYSHSYCTANNMSDSSCGRWTTPCPFGNTTDVILYENEFLYIAHDVLALEAFEMVEDWRELLVSPCDVPDCYEASGDATKTSRCVNHIRAFCGIIGGLPYGHPVRTLANCPEELYHQDCSQAGHDNAIPLAVLERFNIKVDRVPSLGVTAGSGVCYRGPVPV